MKIALGDLKITSWSSLPIIPQISIWRHASNWNNRYFRKLLFGMLPDILGVPWRRFISIYIYWWRATIRKRSNKWSCFHKRFGNKRAVCIWIII